MPSDIDSTNRTQYQSSLQNAMTIISSLIDYQVEHFQTNLSNNPFASKLLIKVCIDYLLQHINDIRAPICLKCLTSLAKVFQKRISIFEKISFESSRLRLVFRFYWKQISNHFEDLLFNISKIVKRPI